MARRWWLRGLEWLGIGVAVLVGVVLAALVLVTQTEFGRERVRRIVVSVASQNLVGTLHIGALRFGPGCALSVDSGSLRDAANELLAAIGPTRATCRFGELVRGRLVLTSLSVERPEVIVRQGGGGNWNWSSVVRPDTGPPPVIDSAAMAQPARIIVDAPIRITGGAFLLDIPDMPRREVSSLTLVARVQAELGGNVVRAELEEFAASLSNPPVVVRRVRGTVSMAGDSIRLEVPELSFGATRASVSGGIVLRDTGTPALALRVTADTIALADLSWLTKQIPENGGGRLDASVTSGGDDGMRIVVHDADLQTTKSALKGRIVLSLDSAGVPSIRQADLDAPTLHTDLLNRLTTNALPPALRGSFRVRIVTREGNGGPLRVDTIDARYTDELTGATSRVTGRGLLTLGGERGGPRASLEMTAHRIDSRIIALVSPSFPLTGIISGTASIVATPDELNITRSDLQYHEGDETVLHIGANGTVSLRAQQEFHLRIDTRSFNPSAVRARYPALSGVPSFEGPIELRGTPSDLSVAASVRGAGGTMTLAGRYQDNSEGISIRSTVRVRDADPRVLSGRVTVPAGSLNADLEINLAGDSLSVLTGTADLSSLTGTLAGIGVDSTVARLSLAGNRLVADSVILATSAGRARVTGALGMRGGVRDTMTVLADVSLAHLQPLLRELAVLDTTAADTLPATTVLDSASGTVHAEVRLVGSVDSLDVSGTVDGADVVMPRVQANRIRASAELAGVGSTPRGRLSVQVDTVMAGGTRFSTVSATATSRDGERWQVTATTGPGDTPGGNVAGAVILKGDTTLVELDSLLLRALGSSFQLQQPARFHFDTAGTVVVDTVALRGSRGARITMAGVLRDTGSIAAVLQLEDAPIALPGVGAEDDSIRMRIDSRLVLAGTSSAPQARLNARIRISAESLAVDSVVAEGSYDAGNARINATAHGLGRTLAVARAAVPMRVSLAPLKAELADEPLEGELRVDSLDLRFLSPLMPGVHASAGLLRTQLTLAGTARQPRATGSLDLRGGAADIEALGIQVTDANAALMLSESRITIRELSARGAGDPGGRAEFSGYVGLGDSATTDLRVRTSTMPIMRSSTVADLDVSADLRLTGAAARPTLSGSINVDRGVIRLPDMGHAGVVGVDDTAFVRLVDSLAPERIRRAPARTDRLEIGNVSVVMGPNVWIRSADASIQLGGSIRLEQAAQRADVTGREFVLRGALLTQRGNYRLNIGGITRSFELEQGSVQFTGEPELNPRLNINALYVREGTEDIDAPRVRLNVGGDLERPVLTLSSATGRLTQAELMSYLITGQTQLALGDVSQGAVTSELVASATGALAQQLAGGTFDVVNVTAGAAQPATSDRGAAASALATSRLGVGKQVSDRVFLKVDAGLCAFAAGGSTDLWQTMGVSLDYRFRRGLLGSLSSAPSTNGATCANQSASRSTARAPRQWGFDLNRIWRF